MNGKKESDCLAKSMWKNLSKFKSKIESQNPTNSSNGSSLPFMVKHKPNITSLISRKKYLTKTKEKISSKDLAKSTLVMQRKIKDLRQYNF